ncbi:pyridoxamine 5'-phosphate oxidase family protein [Paenibacillus roseipurpureus]|uniref:Pyridoxamine 5'-phosphate oxidase family protein n=1 Tax=Paenibacillus roseopurpureus TaxID=2918901 RepID=A0AA96LKU8_9BACL|nr:pyridoxamine 5'-phosphate oxidase family protein [Paenibacillus sp. MBLB1832]WNR43727.1 pyridoxamine 5'-phosphate oxidase family protein [Paenibacillus sp. MBLB1832]
MIETKYTQLEEQIIQVLSANPVCSFATVDGDKPKVRYMALLHEGMTIYLTSSRNTDKVEEVAANPHVHILVGFDGKSTPYILQIQATATISSDNALREKLWKDDMKQWFEGPHDPNYIVLDITPTRIEYSKEGSEPQIWTK